VIIFYAGNQNQIFIHTSNSKMATIFDSPELELDYNEEMHTHQNQSRLDMQQLGKILIQVCAPALISVARVNESMNEFSHYKTSEFCKVTKTPQNWHVTLKNSTR
jgi:hypothetical protein